MRGKTNVLPEERCVANIREEYLRLWRRRQGLTDQCTFRAQYLINGRQLCARHAGEVALDLLVKNSSIVIKKLDIV